MKKNITVKGAVQGVGYRPFISELANEYRLTGSVKNCGAAVDITVSGDKKDIDSFIQCIRTRGPAGAFVLSVDISKAINDTKSYESFTIIDSSDIDLSSEIPVFLPDIGICNDCMNEMLDPHNRRFGYPLISCAVCGPRMSILNRLPYDRNTTTMEDFEMCPSCRRDYVKIHGRRNYAQTISCHDCGPQMIFALTGNSGEDREIIGQEAVKNAINLLKSGGIIGLKGISGYQLVCLPRADIALRLRKIKGRESKPFAVMFSTIDAIKEYAFVSPLEETILKSSARPIVLVKGSGFDSEVVRDSRYIGAFLPSAGIHRLLTDALGPLIVTSANKSDEPMIIDDEAFRDTFMASRNSTGDFEKEKCVDACLYHKRRILMPQDDSVLFTINIDGQEYSQFIRRARGFAPLPIILKNQTAHKNGSLAVLALGGDLKSSFAFGKKDRIMPSQYIGDLGNIKNLFNYDALLNDYRRIFGFKPDYIVKDLHPAYNTSVVAKELGKEEALMHTNLQHHYAHIYSVMAENSLSEALGVSFDGTGYGEDGNIWGGEFVHISGAGQKRLGHLKYMKLVGADMAPKNPSNVSLCYRHRCAFEGLIREDNSLNTQEQLLTAALDNNINTFDTSSAGRLFDAVSALLGICEYNSFEGEAAIKLEKQALDFYEQMGQNNDYPEPDIEITDVGESFIIPQDALFAFLYNCLQENRYSAGALAFGFHMALKDLILKACRIMKRITGINVVCLSGGCFNNRLLLTFAVKALISDGFEVYWNTKVPLGDGGISTGQAYYGLLRGKL